MSHCHPASGPVSCVFIQGSHHLELRWQEGRDNIPTPTTHWHRSWAGDTQLMPEEDGDQVLHPGTCLQCTEIRISIFQPQYQPWLTRKGCCGGTPEPGRLELRDGSINGQLWPPFNLHRVLLE